MGCLILGLGQMSNVLPIVRIALFDSRQLGIVWTLLGVPFGDNSLVGGVVDDFIQTTEAISWVLLLKYLEGWQQHRRGISCIRGILCC
jgi:hypothetical protein